MAREAGNLTLHVLSGLHEGVVQPVGSGALRIGGGAGADLVLADDGMAPVHVELEFTAGWASLLALHPGVTLGTQEVVPGAPVQTLLPAAFCVAGVEFRCEGPAQPSRPRWRRRSVHLPLVTLGACAALALFWHSDQPALASVEADAPLGAATSVPPAAATYAALRSPVAVPTATEPPPSAPAPASAATVLRTKLSEAGLASIKVEDRDGVLMASGLILPADAPRWQAVREGFDRSTGGHVPLRNAVEARADHPVALHVDSVWTGTFPNIIVGGAKYLEGSMLPNGWMLERIGDGRLTLRRGEQQALVAF